VTSVAPIVIVTQDTWPSNLRAGAEIIQIRMGNASSFTKYSDESDSGTSNIAKTRRRQFLQQPTNSNEQRASIKTLTQHEIAFFGL